MVVETLSNISPHSDRLPRPGEKTQPVGDQQADGKTDAKSKANTRAAGKPGGKRHRLGLHLLIGFLMAMTAIGGYAFFGPSASAAVEAGQMMVDMSTAEHNVMAQNNNAVSGGSSGASVTQNSFSANDLAVMQAQMEDITRRMNAIMADNLTSNMATGARGSNQNIGNSGSSTYSSFNSYEQMMTQLRQMMGNMNPTGSPMGEMGHP